MLYTPSRIYEKIYKCINTRQVIMSEQIKTDTKQKHLANLNYKWQSNGHK